MESDNCDSEQFSPNFASGLVFTEALSDFNSQRFISAYMQHITDVCDPPQPRA